jgi:hypothetical protein
MGKRGEIEINASSRPVVTVDRERCVDSTFNDPEVHWKYHRQLLFSGNHVSKCSSGTALLNFHAVDQTSLREPRLSL